MKTGICSMCGQKLNKSDLFCPECGAKVFDIYFCRNCGYESNSGETFCPECGSPLTDMGEFITHRRKKIKSIAIKVAAILTLVALMVGILSFAGAGSFSKMDVWLRGTIQLCTGKSEKACMTLEFLHTSLAEKEIKLARDAAYRKGVREYGKGNYDVAGNCFQVCSDLGQLDIYNTLVACHRYSYYYNDTSCIKIIKQLSDVWDFEDVPEALVANGCVASYWLEGNWQSEDSETYFILNRESGIKCNVPHTGNGLMYGIENSVMYLYSEVDKSDREDVFQFYPMDMNTLCVYSFSSGKYYNLYRDVE